MIIEINLTLIIQIVHFLVAYTLLRVFLWQPIVRYLQSEERHRNLLNREIQKQQTILEQKEFDLLKVKTEAQRAFAQNMPHEKIVTQMSGNSGLSITIKISPVSQDQVDKMAQAIVQKVEE